MGTQNNRLNETVLLSTQNICYKVLVRKYSDFYAEYFCLSKRCVTCLFQLREIRHENVNAIIGFFEEQTSHFIISDYCNRGSLEVCIQKNRVRPVFY